MVWLDQYGAEPFEQQQFGTAGVEGVNLLTAAYYNTGRVRQRSNYDRQAGSVCGWRW